MITYKNRPSWNRAFRGATHILRMRNVFHYFFATEMGHGDFENHDGETQNKFVVIEKKPSDSPVSIANTFIQKPSWSQAFKGATHILSVQDCFIFAINFGARGFKTEDGSILDQFCVIEEKPSNPVTIANTFRNKPDWALAFVGATHIVSLNNLRLQKITYHFAKKTGKQFANSVGTPFTDFTVVDDDSKYPYLRGDGISNLKPGRLNVKIPMVTTVEACQCYDCGYQWQKGQHGGHNCKENLKKQLIEEQSLVLVLKHEIASLKGEK